MAEKVGSERRRYHRIERRASIQFESRGKVHKGTIINFSEVGLLIQTRDVLQPEVDLTIPMKLQSGSVYRVQGVVRWNVPPKPGEGAQAQGLMGIELSAVPVEYLKAVADMRKYASEHSTRAPEDRFDVYHQVKFQSGDSFLSEYTENLSRGGMYLATERILEIGTVIHAQLEIPSFPEPIQVEGKVAYRLDAAAAEERGRTTGVGVQFVNLPEETRQKINHYIQRLTIHRATPERRFTGPIPNSGSLNDFLVPELLLSFYEQQLTGELILRRKGVVKRVYFQRGRPIFVESPLHSETLAQHLARTGLLPLTGMSKWIKLLEQGDMALARGMVSEGLLERDRIVDALVNHQEERLTNTFPWFDGSFEFTHGTDWNPTVSILPLHLHRMVFEGITRWYNSTLIQAWMGLDERSVIKSRVPELTTVLPSVAYQIVHAAWEPRTIGEISGEIGVAPDVLIPACYALVVCDWLVLRFAEKGVSEKPEKKSRSSSAAAPKADSESWRKLIDEDFSRLKNLDYFELLGVSEQSGEDEVMNAFVSRVARYSRVETELDRIQDPSLLGKVSEILSWIRTAKDTLIDPNMRNFYIRDRASPMKVETDRQSFEVEQMLLIVMSQVQERDFEKALAALNPMVEKYPHHSVVVGWYAWALFQTDKNANARPAREALIRAMDLDPSDPQLHFFSGKMFAHEEDWKKAEQSFLQALRLQANFSEATKGLKEARDRLKAHAS